METIYEGIEMKGTLTEIISTDNYVRGVANGGKTLLSPDKIDSTRVKILEEDGNSTCLPVYGVIPESYIGKEIMSRESFYRAEDVLISSQEFYVEGEREFVCEMVIQND